jgi:hypothetical protein
MGLDWRPMGKPKPGFEERYNQIFRIIQGIEKQKEPGFLDKLKGKKLQTKEQLIEEFFDNSIETYETIKAPRVGYDSVANEWIKSKYDETDKSIAEEDFVKQHLGYYVIELAPELDGVPVYIAMGQDENVFRAKFLDDCKELISEDLYNEAWGTKLAPETLLYGQQLMAIADKVATEHNLLYLKDQRIPPDTDEDRLESKVHILYAAAKWLIFYGKNGHGYEADF